MTEEIIEIPDMKKPERGIPLYALYGENDPVEDTEFLHIEEIISRSHLYNWEITPHTHANLFQVIFVSKGDVSIELDSQISQRTGPCIITVPSGVVHGFHMTPKTEGAVISVANDFLNIRPNSADAQTLSEVLSFPAIVDFSKFPGRFHALQEIVDSLFSEFRWPQSGRAIMYDSLLRILLLQVHRKMVLPHKRDRKKGYRRNLFMQFRSLIEDHYKEKWPVAKYAQGMGLTESRLSRICQSFTGKSAFEVVQDRLLLEAQRYLIYTSASVSEITYELGFNDPAYFCRFFKKATGTTPKKFRSDKNK